MSNKQCRVMLLIIIIGPDNSSVPRIHLPSQDDICLSVCCVYQLCQGT